jgi:hypothetical protein
MHRTLGKSCNTLHSQRSDLQGSSSLAAAAVEAAAPRTWLPAQPDPPHHRPRLRRQTPFYKRRISTAAPPSLHRRICPSIHSTATRRTNRTARVDASPRGRPYRRPPEWCFLRLGRPSRAATTARSNSRTTAHRCTHLPETRPAYPPATGRTASASPVRSDPRPPLRQRPRAPLRLQHRAPRRPQPRAPLQPRPRRACRPLLRDRPLRRPRRRAAHQPRLRQTNPRTIRTSRLSDCHPERRREAPQSKDSRCIGLPGGPSTSGLRPCAQDDKRYSGFRKEIQVRSAGRNASKTIF